MPNQLTLRKKGQVFVFSFVIINVVIGGCLTLMLQQAEGEAKRYERSTTAVAKASSILAVLTKAGTTLAFYAYSGRAELGKQYDQLASTLPSDMSELSTIVSPERREKMRRLISLVNSILSEMNAYKRKLDLADESLSMGSMRKRVQPELMKVAQELNQYIDEEREYSRRLDLNASKEMRERMQILIDLLMASSAIGAIVLVRLFTTQITERIDVIAGNAVRLASDASLSPPLGGNDELANLDKIFHKMAASLQAAMDKERQTAVRLHSSEKKVRLLIEHMPVGLVAIDTKGTITATNAKMGTLLGCPCDSLIGLHMSDIFDHKSAHDQEETRQFVFEKALSKVAELAAKRQDGSTFPAEISLNSFETDEGELLLLNMLDVSERHEVERMKREIVAMVSHDLKSPLTSIQGSLLLVTSGVTGDISEKALDILTTAESELERLTRLIRDLLDIEKLEAGKMEVDPECTRLSTIVSRSIASVSQLARDADVELVAEECVLSILADEERLVQVVVNLLSNAVKFSQKGQKVTVEAEALADQLIEVRVIDQGRGIPDDQTDAVFERFHQVHKDDARNKKGTGLGLPICKQIIEQHGGTIGVRSKLGQGSTFWFRLKQAFDASPEAVDATQESTARAT